MTTKSELETEIVNQLISMRGNKCQECNKQAPLFLQFRQDLTTGQYCDSNTLLLCKKCVSARKSQKLKEIIENAKDAISQFFIPKSSKPQEVPETVQDIKFKFLNDKRKEESSYASDILENSLNQEVKSYNGGKAIKKDGKLILIDGIED